MANNRLGELRRSAVVSTFGPGAIVDFRVKDAPVSAVTAGLEEWDRRSPPAGILNPQTVFEPRLQKRLGVAGFRLPPVKVDDDERPSLIAVRFPYWLQCPGCHTLKPASKWNQEPGDAARSCGACTAAAGNGQKVFAVPVRFVCACENGHLDEFPWNVWVGHKPGCKGRGSLGLVTEGAGLAGLILRCNDPECGASRSMDGVFSKKALQGLKCFGRRPWLAGADEQCDQTPRALQRGASNLYFPVTLSALDIPPWSDNIQKMLGQFWDPISKTAPEFRPRFIESLLSSIGHIGHTAGELAQLVEERLRILESPEAKNLRWDEYQQFTTGRASVPEQDLEFEIRPQTLTSTLKPYVRHLVRAVRLREVRAITGFTRINAPPLVGDEVPVQAPLSERRLTWLPAIEVRGEGIFLTLNNAQLAQWESQQLVMARAAKIDQMFGHDWKERFGDEHRRERIITPRMVLLHTLAHILMRQLSLECGYSSASLRERLYVGENPTDMAGVLLYTATTDADGTLGGLARQGSATRIEGILVQALRSMQWCSTDPLCISGMASASESFNLSACHACVLAPETSCEEYNRFLDRAMIVGTPEAPTIGFFRKLLAS